MHTFSIIVAFDQTYGIGYKNRLPWKLSSDLKYFREITSTCTASHLTNAVIMGRNTWESLPIHVRPLKNRMNIVLTQDKYIDFGENVNKAHSLDEALLMCGNNIDQVFIMGGAKVYEIAIQHSACQSIFVTHVKGTYHCDVFFPPISPDFMLISASEEHKEDGIYFQFCHYMKRS